MMDTNNTNTNNTAAAAEDFRRGAPPRMSSTTTTTTTATTTTSPRTNTTTTNTTAALSPEVIRQRRRAAAARFSRLYAWMSLGGALLAIGLATPRPFPLMDAVVVEPSSKLSAAFTPPKPIDLMGGAASLTMTKSYPPALWWLRKMMALPDQGQWKDPIHTNNNNNNKETITRMNAVLVTPTTTTTTQPALSNNECRAATQVQSNKPAWWHPFLLLPQTTEPKKQHQHGRETSDSASSCVNPQPTPPPPPHPPLPVEEEAKHQTNMYETLLWLARAVSRWLDPTLMQPSGHTLTDLIDKILTSTPRLLAISNFLLTLTYIVHSAVADWFLVQPLQAASSSSSSTITEPQGAREKMGGFLIFKLLLISAVMTPDTLDLLILLSWYTLLSFLRSLAHLAAHAIHYATAAGQAPAKPVLHLLYWVGLFNLLAAVSCVALFKAAGMGMVLLLTCDCALTALYVTSHIFQHLQATWEVQHAAYLTQLEQEGSRGSTTAQPPENNRATSNAAEEETHTDADVDNNNNNNTEETTANNAPVFPAPRNEQMERRIQVLEQEHNRRIVILETLVFYLQLAGHLLTVLHFLHIWTLHGIQFTLIDGVLCLHLHSAISAASRKICQRRNVYRIARDLDDVFSDATELELRKSHQAGDVCCVCLSSMTMHVKKVACGHLYHTACLREVVERARTMEAAKCPLCRASLLDGHYHSNSNHSSDRNNDVNVIVDRGLFEAEGGENNGPNNNNNAGGRGEEQMLVEDQALFRVSTEGLIPSWLHIPSVSFEVVRRAPLPPILAAAANNDTNDANDNPIVAQQQQQQQQQQQPPSWFRRFLIMAGAIPMTPEEEAIALEQLVDMFPQYDRADLLRELRERSSAEAVAESILAGSFQGTPR